MAPREGVTVIREVSELSQVCGEAETVFVIGGARVYEELLPQCDGLYLTYITKDYEGDVLLPPFEHLFTLAEVLETSGDLEFRRYEQG
jgi:dihydrofolate reductase